MSLSIRRVNKDLKDYVLDEDGYQYNEDKTYKKKSRKCPREIIITKKDANGKTIKVKENVDEQQVVFWSADYAKRAKVERQPAIDKARALHDIKIFRKCEKMIIFTRTFGKNLHT